MRDFNNLSALPGHIITIDGESYDCPDVEVRDIQGSVRAVPADRVLAVHWHGDHRHGSVEGFGAMEGFADKLQLGNYVTAWLRARLKAKADALDAILRSKKQMEEAIVMNEDAAEAMRSDIAQHPETAAVNQPRLDAIDADVRRMRSMIPTADMIAAARAELDNAQIEADADA